MSAYTVIEVTFGFNKTPLAHPGWKFSIHSNLYLRINWATHGAGGWYIGPYIENYICHHIYFNSTISEQIVDTVEFFPHHTKMPFMPSVYSAYLSTTNLTEALLNTNPEAPFSHISETYLVSLRELETLFLARLNKPGAHPRVVQTSPARSVEEPSLLRVDTPVPPRVACRFTAPYPMVGTLKTPSPTIPYACTIRCRSQLNKTSMIPQE